MGRVREQHAGRDRQTVVRGVFVGPHSRAAYRWVLLVYGIVFCGGYIPIMIYFMPSEPFMIGQVQPRLFVHIQCLSHYTGIRSRSQSASYL